MLVSAKEMLEKAVAGHYAVGQFNINNLEWTKSIPVSYTHLMTNKCTYLYGEDVLPKDSLLYSKFMVLNELNNLRLNGEKISTELKQRIYEEVFCRTRKVTQKKLKKYLCIEGIEMCIRDSGRDVPAIKRTV